MSLQYFGERLRGERLRVGVTQDEMAVKLGVSKRSYCAYESGETAPNAKLLSALSEIDGVTLEYMLTGRTLQERAAQAAAGMPDRLRALREERGLDAVLKVAQITARQWHGFETSEGAPTLPPGMIERLCKGFDLDAMKFITGQSETITTDRTEEVLLLKNYRVCSEPDQDAIRHQAQFLASRKALPTDGRYAQREEAHPMALHETDPDRVKKNSATKKR